MSGAYFLPDYFGASTPGPGISPCPGAGDGGGDVAPLDDAGCVRWARDQLASTDLFGSVTVGSVARPLTRESFPIAWVWPIGFEERDDVDPFDVERTLRYAVQITVSVHDDDDDGMLAIAEMDFLSNSAANVLTGQAPPGAIPGRTRIDGGRYDSWKGSLTQPKSATGDPRYMANQTGLMLVGSITYLVPGRASRLAVPVFPP
jgi:hypothetical protein